MLGELGSEGGAAGESIRESAWLTACWAAVSLTRVSTLSYRVRAASASRCSSFSFTEAALPLTSWPLAWPILDSMEEVWLRVTSTWAERLEIIRVISA